MDSTELILTGHVSPPMLLEQNLENKATATDEQKKQFAKDFESVFLDKLFNEMKKTIVDWSSEKDGTAKQIEGIFWMYLARGVAEEGGLGLWKDIYKSLTENEQGGIAAEMVDESI